MTTPLAFWSNGQPMLDFGQGAPVRADASAMARAREAAGIVMAPLGLAPSFGFGDRIGLATPGHAASLLKASRGRDIKPIFAQQSIREMTRTGRPPQQVMDEACFGVLQAGYRGPQAADADHLKTEADVDRTAAAGFCFFTIDPSDDVDTQADNYGESQLRDKFAAVRHDVSWFDAYRGKTITLPTGRKIELSEVVCMRAAVKYGRAINRALRIARHIDKVKSGRGYEIELSVDETPQPTTLAEHYIVAEQCLKGGMKLVSLAPRYIGDFEKGVDYKGDLSAFEKSFADHAAIAQILGGYKLSLHSGSDKLSIYPIFSRITKGRFHVKTAGTSYLEALRVVAIHEPSLFRDLVSFARRRYDEDKKTYHVSATVEGVPAVGDLETLYLERWADVKPGAGFTAPGRQILHCTFGSTLTDPTYGPAVRKVLLDHPETYAEVLAIHFAKHLESLGAGM